MTIFTNYIHSQYYNLLTNSLFKYILKYRFINIINDIKFKYYITYKPFINILFMIQNIFTTKNHYLFETNRFLIKPKLFISTKHHQTIVQIKTNSQRKPLRTIRNQVKSHYFIQASTEKRPNYKIN